jgi:short subunit dehydrogenase-like uncharacterized protein
MAPASRRIVLLGATGYTGQRVLRDLLARGETPTLVGRDRARMQAVAERLGADLPAVEVDVTATRDIVGVLDADDVVVSTVGPFMQLGIPTITAAAQAGAHYLDSTGEGGFVRYAAEHLDRTATNLGATIVPAFGYDYVPGNLAGALALTQAGDRARRVEVGYFLTRSGRGDEVRYRSTLRDVLTLTTPGTRTTVVAGIAEDGFAYRRPGPGAQARLVDERVGKRAMSFRHAGVTRSTMSVAGSEHLGLPEAFPQLESVEVGVGWLGRWTRPTQLIAALTAPVTRLPTTRAALTRLSTRLPAAGREPDSDGRSLIIAVASDNSGAPLTTTVLTGPDPYEMTASLLAWGATRAASPGAQLAPGVHGPVTAFGLDALEVGAAQAGIQQITQERPPDA